MFEHNETLSFFVSLYLFVSYSCFAKYETVIFTENVWKLTMRTDHLISKFTSFQTLKFSCLKSKTICLSSRHCYFFKWFNCGMYVRIKHILWTRNIRSIPTEHESRKIIISIISSVLLSRFGAAIWLDDSRLLDRDSLWDVARSITLKSLLHGKASIMILVS